ncbi:MAG: site-2 protease family protein [Clostridia bacterium]|nr:site-2 protease family protein [Clostridia bacterium]
MFGRLQWYINYLTSDPLGFLLYVLYFSVTVLLSLILHEISHGYVAFRCGDPTAKWMGRLSLDPRKHLDPIGTICMVFLGFGWAKPVPVNPRNFHNYRRDDFLVSVAGICMNLSLFILCAALSVGINRLMWTDEFYQYLKSTSGNMLLALDPYQYSIAYRLEYGMVTTDMVSFMAHPWLQYVQRFLLMMGQINLSLAVFNLIPIPPLDGYHLVNDTILKGKLQLDRKKFQIAQIVLLVVCLSGALTSVLTWANETIYSAVLHLFLLMTGAA